eukprot:TRINITY_DN4318_c0_g1_i3.p1 TRINITY_DN4318_c0_g1~~TRINITY_DN4318_c0_g1_i3.p1  ORF type:complete len:444 (-),score=56.39 TRINITY_DN4318_c0_g1_i3:1108-2439(-)
MERMSKRRYLVLLLLFFGLFILYLLRVNLSIAIVPMSHTFHWDNQTEGFVLSSFYYGYLLTQILGGILSDQFGGFIMLSIGVFMSCFFTLVVPFVSQSLVLLIGARVLCGLFEGITIPAMYSILGNWASVKEKSVFVGVLGSGGVAGLMFGMAVTPLVIEPDWSMAFYLPFGLGLIWLIWWIFLAAKSPEDIPKKCIFNAISQSEIDHLANENEEKATGTPPILSILACRHVWAMVISHTTSNWGFYIFLSWLPTYLNTELNFDLKSAGFISVLPYLMQFVSKGVAGEIGDIFINKNIMSRTITRKVAQSIASGGGALCLIVLVVADVTPTLIVTLIVATVTLDGFCSAGYNSCPLDLSSKYSGIIYGISNTVATIPGIVGVYLTGFIIESWGWNGVWITTIISYVIGLIGWNLLSTGNRIDFDAGGRFEWRYEEDTKHPILN